jgi:UDP-GlcNAc3NAcA epimerase
MPEEINRITCDHVSTLLFSPTATGVENLAREGIVHSSAGTHTFDQQGVYHCGDLMYDNTLYFKKLSATKSTLRKELGLTGKEYLLATIHRPSNTDVEENLKQILEALHGIATEKRVPVILPLHPRTARIIGEMNAGKTPFLKDPSGLLRFIPAVSFLDMISLESGAKVILTDSGGVQKEAWFMEKPVVVLRQETEWVEIIESGNGRLVGSDREMIMEATRHFLESPPGSFPPLFGDGHAAREILNVLTTVRWE